jgi:glutaryl-CoA dehydrogenase
LTNRKKLVRQTARDFLDSEVLPVIRAYRDGIFTTALIPEMGRLGFFGANLEGGCRSPAGRSTARGDS